MKVIKSFINEMVTKTIITHADNTNETKISIHPFLYIIVCIIFFMLGWIYGT